jgi:nucleotide-binding universal stress UspA family protein
MIEKLLVPVDGSDFGEESVPYAATLSKRADVDVDLIHVHVPHPPDNLLANTQFQYEGVSMSAYDQRDRAQEIAYLESLADRIAEASGHDVHGVMLDGTVEEAIDLHARGEVPGLILMSTHGRTGLSRAWLGSVADSLVRHAPWPMLLVRPSHEIDADTDRVVQFERMLVPLDGSDRSECILGPAVDLAKAMDTHIKLLYVVPSPSGFGTRFRQLQEALSMVMLPASEYLENVANRIRARGVTVDVEVLEDQHPAHGILDVAERDDVDLVALATHGYRGVRRAILGSVADKVLRAAEVPLLLVGPGWIGERITA